MRRNSPLIKIKNQSSVHLNRCDNLNSKKFSLLNSLSSRDLVCKKKSVSQIKLPKISHRNNSDVNIYKDESFQKLYDKFKKHHRLRLKLFSPVPTNRKLNEKEKNKIILNNLYKKNEIDLNKKIHKKKLSERDLKVFEPKKYQLNLLEQMRNSVEFKSVLDLKNKYIILNNKYKGKNNNLLNRWINLALKVEGITPNHLLKKFCEIGKEKNEGTYIW